MDVPRISSNIMLLMLRPALPRLWSGIDYHATRFIYATFSGLIVPITAVCRSGNWAGAMQGIPWYRRSAILNCPTEESQGIQVNGSLFSVNIIACRDVRP